MWPVWPLLVINNVNCANIIISIDPPFPSMNSVGVWLKRIWDIPLFLTQISFVFEKVDYIVQVLCWKSWFYSRRNNKSEWESVYLCFWVVHSKTISIVSPCPWVQYLQIHPSADRKHLKKKLLEWAWRDFVSSSSSSKEHIISATCIAFALYLGYR